MTPWWPTGFGGAVTPVRVLIRLSPPLVGDLLARLVRSDETDPAVEVSTDASAGDADILITSEPVPSDPPPTVMVLEDPIAPGTATVLGGGRTEEIEVLDLDADRRRRPRPLRARSARSS